MDFHALSRRELQALCKRNAIRANMTNAAMAEALQGLPSVDGIDELKETVSIPSRHAKSAAPGRGASFQPASATVALRRSQRKAAWKAAGPAEAEQQSVVHVPAGKRTTRSAMSRMAMPLAESSDGAIGSAVENVAVVMEERRTKPQEEDETSEENDLTEAKGAAAHGTPQAELIDYEASEDNLDEDEEDDEASEDNLDEDEEDDEASEDSLDEGKEWASNDDRAAEETDYTDGSDKENDVTTGLLHELNTEGIQEEEVRAKELQKQLLKDLHGVSLSKFRSTYKELLAAEAAKGKMLPPAEVDYNACVIS